MHDQKQKIEKQYGIIVNDYRQIMQSIQNVITINLAVTMGITAALILIISNHKTIDFNSFLVRIALIWLLLMGLVATIASIKTINVQVEETMPILSTISNMEIKLQIKNVHQVKYYKPIHITLMSFHFFAISFYIGLVGSMVFLLTNFFDLWICTIISIAVVALISFLINMASDTIYKRKNDKFITKYKNDELDI